MRTLPSYFGLDFGFTNDPSVFVHVKVDKRNKILYFMECYAKQGMLNDEIAQVIKSMGYGKELIVADAAEKKSIAEIRRLGINRIVAAKKGPDSVMFGLNFMQQFKLVIDERATPMIEELDNYTWVRDKATGEYINKPIDDFNHVIDATRYAIERLALTSDVSVHDKLYKLKQLGLGR